MSFQSTSDTKDNVNSSELVKTSFFDEIKDIKLPIQSHSKDHFIWLHPQDPFLSEIPETFQPLNHPYLNKKVIIEGTLLSRSKKTNSMKKRFYSLTCDRLLCYKNQKKEKERRVMLLQGLKLEVFDQNFEDEEEEKVDKSSIKNKKVNENLERQCFFLSRNKKYDILFVQDKNEYQLWLEELKKLCVLTYFGKYYNNLKVIGKGTFAKVILSKRINDNKDFAIKTFDKKSILSSKSANRTRAGLLNEINIMRNLNHPNIIKLYEVYEGEYHIYLVLELLKGGELFDRIIKKGHYSEKDASILIGKLLWALEYIHERGIMHRDIKPENLILKDDNEYEIKLADFGLAEKLDNKKDLLFKRCGTPGYVAPEVLEDKKYDTKVDIYSAGVILYILLTGCSPFYGKSYNEILLKNKSGLVNFNFEEIKIILSIEAVDLLKQLLEKDPKARPSAIEALKHPWIQRYMTSEVKSGLSKTNVDGSLDSVQENMKKFQENRFAMKATKPDDMIVNSPLITGKTDSINFKTDSPMGSPLLTPAVGFMKRESKNISDIHKKVLLKNLGHKNNMPKEVDDNDEVSEEGSPIDMHIKKLKNDEKPFKPSMDTKQNTCNSPYTASPLGKKPRGSIDEKKVSTPLKTNEVKFALQNLESKK